MLLCRVLGPTTATDDGTPIDLGGPLPRRLLTTLLLAEGASVADERLAGAVWGDETPTRAAPALQVYVSRLRRALGSSGRGLLVRTGTGYQFRLPPAAVDAARFAGEVERGRRLLVEGTATEAERAFAGALAWWRGEPYADLLDTTEVTAARARLAELHEVAVEERLAARLSAGDAPSAAAELDAAVRAAPYRERRWALRILALYRCGRQGEALAALRAVRALLADELGIDPGPELQRLERLVLAQDPRLLLPEPGPAPATPRRRFGRPLSSFVGRDAELATVGDLLTTHRLVTLTGPAGVGKTRLAVEYGAARPDTDGQWDGPWLARLADARQPEVVAHAVADAVGLAHIAGEPETALLDALATRSGLLVLDNCEHLVGAVAGIAVALLTGCPGLRILATSREPLGVDGEATVAVAPLPVRTEDGADGPAVLLLHDRIRAVRPGWRPTAEERPQVRRMCVALDGLPLAIELAATRARMLGLAEIAEHLDDRFALLGAVPRGSLAAHATLRAAIAWSVDLLSEADRALLLRLWPFEGGFSLEATDAVRPAGTAVSALESLSTLVTRSVVQADTTESPTRYRLLETIRSYCRVTDPDPDGTRDAHAAWVRRMAARAGSDLRGRHSAMAMRTLSRELPNLRAGIAHDLAHRPHEAVRTVGALDWFWVRGGHLTEGKRLTEAALRAAPDAPRADRARVHLSRCSIAALAVDEEVIHSLVEQAYVAVGESSGESAGESSGDEHRALYGNLRYYSALLALSVDDAERALELADEAVAIGAELGLDWIRVAGLMIRNAALTRLGRTDEGEAGLAATVVLAERTGQLWSAAWSEFALALSYLNHPATHAAALDALRHAHARFRGEHDALHSLAVLYTSAHALTVTGHPRRAARLRAAVQHHATRLGARPEVLRRFGSPTVDDVVDGALDPAELSLADAEGARLTWPEMVALLAP